MKVSKRTLRQHQSMWNDVTQRIDAKLREGTSPEHYFESMTACFDNSEFLSKSRRGVFNTSGLKVKDFYLDVGLDLVLNAQAWCAKARSYMVRNHPWHNRTYNAESGLGATVAGMENDKLVMYLYHSVPYGKYLEGENGFRYPRAGLLHIIQPTIEILGPSLISSFQGVLNR